MDNRLFIRGPIPEDNSFLYDTWKNGILHGCRKKWPEKFIDPVTKKEIPEHIVKEITKRTYVLNLWYHIPAQIFSEQYQRIIEHILSRPNVVVKLACLKEDPEVIIGYIIYEGPTIHWIFVKASWRGMGVARALYPDGITTCSHLTLAGWSLAEKYNVVFNPFI